MHHPPFLLCFPTCSQVHPFSTTTPEVPRNLMMPLLFYHNYVFSYWSPPLACELPGTASTVAG